ncbi:MAG: type I-C CRISPR-associated protein Cas8c/Csd1 [Ruminococcaceae bacterium]|jgi:CRISPR-associated protein Csd1|nr:type I-C CRISPR-associated protein Cas8c/Csd1 [Oscillospiraceae bacterium]
MILQALTSYYESLAEKGQIARPGWSSARIAWAIMLDRDGVLRRIAPLQTQAEGRKPQAMSFVLPAPVKRTVAIDPNFLWDNASYLLGIDSKGKPERSRRCFEAAAALHHKLLDDLDSAAARAICRFFDSWEPAEASAHPALNGILDQVTAGGNLLFMADGSYAHDDPQIKRAWQSFYDGSGFGEIAQCLVTGKAELVAPVHPAIKGVMGAQSSGAALVSFNAPAFNSYGKEQGYNAPIGKSAAFAYTAALNHLLSEKNSHKQIGDTTIVYWAEGGETQYQGFSAAAMFEDAPPEGMDEDAFRSAVAKLAKGLPCPEQGLDPDRTFYILGLTPNAARLSVRFFYRDSFGRLMKNVNDHHERMAIVRPSYDPHPTIPLWALLRETVNQNARTKTPSPVMAGAVARAVFSGGLYPASLLQAVMLRIRAEHEVTRGRAAIIKAYYLRLYANMPESTLLEVMQMQLNESCTYLPYVLGRLFAIMEKIQIESVNGPLNRTIKDSLFNAAATTPNSAFARLFPLNEYHLKKLLRDKKGLGIIYDNMKSHIAAMINSPIPSRFSNEETNCFYIGYYHQRHQLYEKKEG